MDSPLLQESKAIAFPLFSLRCSVQGTRRQHPAMADTLRRPTPCDAGPASWAPVTLLLGIGIEWLLDSREQPDGDVCVVCAAASREHKIQALRACKAPPHTGPIAAARTLWAIIVHTRFVMCGAVGCIGHAGGPIELDRPTASGPVKSARSRSTPHLASWQIESKT